jgi:hypothetical protein
MFDSTDGGPNWEVWFVADVTNEPIPLTKLVIDSLSYLCKNGTIIYEKPYMSHFEKRGGSPRAEAYFWKLPLNGSFPPKVSIRLFVRIEDISSNLTIADSIVKMAAFYKQDSPKVLKN